MLVCTESQAKCNGMWICARVHAEPYIYRGRTLTGDACVPHRVGMAASIERLRDYVEQVTGGASLRSIAAATGYEPSTLSRQFVRKSVPVETVIAIARAYHGDILLGLVVGGFITEDEAAGFTGRGSLAEATDLQIAQETLRRMRATPSMVAADDSALDDSALDDGNRSASTHEHRILAAVSGPHLQTRHFAEDAAASVSPVSIYDEAAAVEEQP